MPNFSGVWNLKEQIQAIAAGRWTGLPTGELYAWGFNSNGQVGDGTTISKSSPVQITGEDWAQVSAGGQTASVKTDGTLWAWGNQNPGGGNPISGVGDGTILSRSSPTQIGNLTNWAQVSTGSAHTACVKTDGTLWSWGTQSPFLRRGALGDGTTVDRSSPVQVGALTNWAQVSAGFGHTACVKTDGTLWTWGNNTYGSLGHNNIVYRSSPVQVGALTDWAQVSAGDKHTAAVTTGGELYAWGRNQSYGALGDGTVINRSSPVQIGALTNWAQVSGGTTFHAAIKTDGTFWAWGLGNYGNLGQGTVINRSSPVQVGALTNWAQASAGRRNTAAVKTDGTMWTWGNNSSGQLGDGTVISKSSPVQVDALTNWSQVSAGVAHTAAILQGTTN